MKLSWSLPPDDGGSPITEYIIDISTPDERWNSGAVAGTDRTYTLTGLTNGETYIILVAAKNESGLGAWSAPITVSPRWYADAPPDVTATVAPADGVGAGEVKLTWTAPADNGSEIWDYWIESSTDGTTWTMVPKVLSSDTTYIVGGLSSGTQYSFRVAARNNVGLSGWSDPVDATPASTPAAPPRLSATAAPAGDLLKGFVQLNWDAPSANGSAITDYVVESSTDGDTWAPVGDGRSTSTAAPVGGLTNGTKYWFRVAAVNAIGTGSWSDAIDATPTWSPETPGGLTAAVAPAAGVGSGEVRLTWTEPPNNGSAITDYDIEWHIGNQLVGSSTSTETTLTMDGLENGTNYRFRVAAKNAAGWSSWSAAVTAAPLFTPTAPGELTGAVAPAEDVESGQVQLTWTAPSTANGAAITDYVIESSIDGTTWTPLDDGESTATTFTASGLTNGTAYVFRVAAVNAVGTGPWSGTIDATPVWTPDSANEVAAAVAPADGVGSGEVQLTWSEPSANGAPITDYVIESSTNGSMWTPLDDGESAVTTFTASGLTNGTAYVFRVAAVNAVGTGPWSAPVNATPMWTPEAPAALVAAVAPADGVGSGEVKLAWSEPTSTGGGAITGYVIESSIDGSTWTRVEGGKEVSSTSLATTFTVGGLTNGTSHSFRVAAVNAVGAGPWSSTVDATPVGTPAAPGQAAAAVAPESGVGSGSVRLTWNTPASTGGVVISDYVIQSSTSGGPWTTVEDGVSTATRFTIRGLTNGTGYRFRVAAENAIGAGAWSATLRATPAWRPTAPLELRAAVAPAGGVGSRQVKLTWRAPASTGGNPITDYVIQRSVDRTRWMDTHRACRRRQRRGRARFTLADVIPIPADGGPGDVSLL